MRSTVKWQPKQYQVDLKQLMRTCEMNYLFLSRIINDKRVGAEVEITVADHLCYRLRVIFSSRFTYELLFEQINHTLPDWLVPSMKIRVYSDARMAEVCASQQISYLEPSYNYPNKRMHHRNEKEQVNLFLHEWLKLCIERGYNSEVSL